VKTTRRRLTMLDFREMLRLYYDVHLSYRDIARALKTHHSTVSRCLARFETAGGTWPLANTVTDHDLQRWMHPQPLGRPRTRPEPDWPRAYPRRLAPVSAVDAVAGLERIQGGASRGLSIQPICHPVPQLCEVGRCGLPEAIPSRRPDASRLRRGHPPDL